MYLIKDLMSKAEDPKKKRTGEGGGHARAHKMDNWNPILAQPRGMILYCTASTYSS